MPLPAGFALETTPPPAAPPQGGLPPGFSEEPAQGTTQAGPSPNQGQGQGHVTEDHVDDYLQNSAWYNPVAVTGNLLAGIGAGVEETGAGLDTLARRVTGTKKTAAEESFQRLAAQDTHGTMQKVGKVAESAGEFFTGEELLGMLGRTGTVMNAAEKLKAATGLATIANKVPMVGKLLRIGMETVRNEPAAAPIVNGIEQAVPTAERVARIGMNAVRSGTIAGTQEYAKTGGDMGAAATSGGVTGALETALGTAGLGVRALADVAPVQKFLESVPITALKSQVNKFGRFIPGSAEDLAPKIADQQQEAAQQVIRNVAAKATGTAIDDINATRQAIIPPSRQLPAPADAQPFTFHVGTTGETAAHPMSEEAAQAHRATIEGLLDKFANPSLRKTITPEERAAWNEAHQALYGMEDTLAEGGAMQPPGATAGGAAASTTNPAEAQRWLQDREDLMRRPEWDQVPQAQKDQIQSEVDQLRGQLGVYHTGYRQTLQQLDKDAITSQVHTFGHGEAQLRGIARPVIEQVANMTKDRAAVPGLMDEIANAQTAITKADNAEDFNAAVDRYRKANQDLQGLVDRHSAQLTPADYSAATKAMGQASKLGELHGVFESMMNGVTHEETEGRQLSRVMTGNAQRLQDWLDKPGNTQMVDSLIGKESRYNLKELTLLMSKASTNRNTAAALKEIAHYVMSHGGGHLFLGGGGAVAGALLAPLFGESWQKGAGTGLALGSGMRMAYRLAATNPRIGNTLIWAVKNGMDPKSYASMIGDMLPRALAEPMRAQGQMATQEDIDKARQEAAAGAQPRGEQGGGEQ